MQHLIWVCTVWSGLSVPILMTIMIVLLTSASSRVTSPPPPPPASVLSAAVLRTHLRPNSGVYKYDKFPKLCALTFLTKWHMCHNCTFGIGFGVIPYFQCINLEKQNMTILGGGQNLLPLRIHKQYRLRSDCSLWSCLIRIYIVCHSAIYFKMQLHKMQNLG